MTSQLITQSMPPKEGDQVALIDRQAISGWSDRSLVAQPTDRTVPNGTLATFASRSPTHATRRVTSRPYRNPALTVGSAAADSAIIRSRMIADEASTAFYDTVRLTGTNQSFTCYNGPVWLI
jgi:hypothetical protein